MEKNQQNPEIATSVQELLEEKERELRVRNYFGGMAKIISVIAIIWSIFQLYVNSVGVLDAIKLRTWHILFLITMVFLLYPATKKEKRSRKFVPLYDLVFIALGIGSFGYLLLNYNTVVMRGGYLIPQDYVVATIAIIVVFEAARRVVGNLAILALFFLLYNFLGPFIPGVFGHTGFTWKKSHGAHVLG